MWEQDTPLPPVPGAASRGGEVCQLLTRWEQTGKQGFRSRPGTLGPGVVYLQPQLFPGLLISCPRAVRLSVCPCPGCT